MNRFDFIEPPLPFVCAPEETRHVEDRQNTFFTHILNKLGYESDASKAFCGIRSRELLREGDEPIEHNLTNDRLTELLVRNRTVATVLSVRTETNHVQANFAHYVTPELELFLRFRED